MGTPMASTPAIAIVGGGPAGLSLAALLERKGVTDYIVFERSAPETVPRGSCLDLHTGSGQKVFRDIGAYDEMKEAGRWGEASIHYIVNHHLERLFEFGEGRDAPEVDRWDIRRILLNHIPKDKVRFSSAVERAYRAESGSVTLEFTSGETMSGFKLVVGADGAFSKIRPLITPAKLIYTGHTILSTAIKPQNPHYDKALATFTRSNMAICGLGNAIWCAPQGKGIISMDLVIEVPDTFPDGFELDLNDFEANKNFLLKKEHFGHYAPEVRDAIKASEGPWRPWRLYHMPADCFNWPSQPDVTLIGDAAHATTPWVGDGVNCSMRDALILTRTLSEMGITGEAVVQYEKEMFVWAEDLISRCIVSGELFLQKDNPYGLVKFLKARMTDIIGGTDDV